MRKTLAFLAVGLAWILFSGLVSVNFQPLPVATPQTLSPAPRILEFPRGPAQKFPSYLSHLERRWKTERLLSTSA
jgi:hypothetical protein